MIQRTMGTVMVAGLLLVPLGATSASATGSSDDVKCAVKAIKEGTGLFWCWGTTPPPP